jgi:hypothetical protein
MLGAYTWLMDDAALPKNVSDLQVPQPRLHPAPGRCIIRVVPRLLSVGIGETGVTAELDGRYENQPMVGTLEEIGDLRNDADKAIADWAIDEKEQGHYFLFSSYGSGSPYWNDEMKKMLPLGYDFTWLQGFRLFDIAQLACTVEGAGVYGENAATRARHALAVAALRSPWGEADDPPLNDPPLIILPS